MLLLFAHDLLLKLALSLRNIKISEKWVILVFLDCHQSRLTALALDVLENLVVRANLFLVFSENAANTIDGSISDELLKLWPQEIRLDFIVEHNVKSRTNFFVHILIMAKLRDTIGKRPVVTFTAIRRFNQLPLSFGHLLVEADVDEGLLLEERLVALAD